MSVKLEFRSGSSPKKAGTAPRHKIINMITSMKILHPVSKLAVFLRWFNVAAMVLLAAGCSDSAHRGPSGAAVSPYAQWSRGPSPDPGFFPIAVWMQDPALAGRYQAAGFNTYVALPYVAGNGGPTEDQLTVLKQSGMRVICEQNAIGLKHLDDPTIIGWMQGDEPDVKWVAGEGQEAAMPILPEKIIADYAKIRANDPSRPIFLNLANGDMIERGARRGHMEDYPEYIKGCDLVSFDVYPVSNVRPEVTGNLWLVADGVDRLVQWSEGRKVVWNCLECTRINNINRRATPQEVRCEAWMSILHGSRGLVWFVHDFKPVLNESALLDDPEMLVAVTAINRQIQDLARVINSPALTNIVSVKSENTAGPVESMVRHYDGAVYLFAVGMRGEPTKATFQVAGQPAVGTVEVIGENRTIPAHGGAFVDQFNPWDVHLYRISRLEN